MQSEWITDRLPTDDDAVHYCVFLWDDDKGVLVWSHDAVNSGQPWMPIPKPEPYVKPKRWTVEWYDPNNCWHVIDTTIDGVMGYLHLELSHADAAQRIADIYNEVMP
jgi:hypothetical protein